MTDLGKVPHAGTPCWHHHGSSQRLSSGDMQLMPLLECKVSKVVNWVGLVSD